MILYCDTSALVKLYVIEAESAAIKGLVAASDVVAVCRIAWAEAFAAFSRRTREAPADAAAIEDARHALARDWPELLVLEVTQPVVERAGEFADTFALRAYDAVQLAAAHHAMAVAQEPLVFACFDARLNKASRVLGMEARFGL
ncbi:MAG: type II toxin-antitoxin system VapC family toxin [Gammaproteobacteria bacterium]